MYTCKVYARGPEDYVITCLQEMSDFCKGLPYPCDNPPIVFRQMDQPAPLLNTPATSSGSAADVDVTTITAPPTVQVWRIYVLLDLFFPVVSSEFCHPKGGFSRSVWLQLSGVCELSWKMSSVLYMFYAWSGALLGFASHMSRCQTNCPLYGSSWTSVESYVGLYLVGEVLTVSFNRVVPSVAPMMRCLMLKWQMFYLSSVLSFLVQHP